MALVGGILIHLFEKPVVIVSTSLLGSYLIVLGVDEFAKTGFNEAVKQFVRGARTGTYDTAIFTTSGKIYGLLVTAIVLTILGVLVQYRMNSGRGFRHTKSK